MITEHHHKYEDPAKIVDEPLIQGLLEKTKAAVGSPSTSSRLVLSSYAC